MYKLSWLLLLNERRIVWCWHRHLASFCKFFVRFVGFSVRLPPGCAAVVAYQNTLGVTSGNEVPTSTGCNFKSICRIQEFLGVLKRSGCVLSQNNSQRVPRARFPDQKLTAKPGSRIFTCSRTFLFKSRHAYLGECSNGSKKFKLISIVNFATS